MNKILEVEFVTSVYPSLRRVTVHRAGGNYMSYLPTESSRNRLWKTIYHLSFFAEANPMIATHLYFKIRES